MSDIEWRDVPGYEGLYEVCRDGRVRNSVRGNELVGTPNGHGYLAVSLTKNRINKKIRIHRILYAVFIGDIPAGNHVHHINGDMIDNRLENLQCLTFDEHNKIHPCNFQTRKANIEDDGPKVRKGRKLDENDVRTIIDMLAKGVSPDDLSRDFNVTRTAILNIRAGRTWKYLDRSSIPFADKRYRGNFK